MQHARWIEQVAVFVKGLHEAAKPLARGRCIRARRDRIYSPASAFQKVHGSQVASAHVVRCHAGRFDSFDVVIDEDQRTVSSNQTSKRLDMAFGMVNRHDDQPVHFIGELVDMLGLKLRVVDGRRQNNLEACLVRAFGGSGKNSGAEWIFAKLGHQGNGVACIG